MKRTSRKPSNLSELLQRHLNAYALAASAAGVGMLAFANPAEAKIVYTPSGQNILGRVPLDLNHDGTADFFFDNTASHTTYEWFGFLSISPTHRNKRTNQVWGMGRGGNRVASALSSGVRVGRKGPFYPGQGRMASGGGSHSGGCSNFEGPWAYATNRYLGLKFIVGKEAHFGWARLNVSCSVYDVSLSATLTGYAYETVPNKPIITGKTKGPDVITLGHLAQGALGGHRRIPRPQ